MDLVQAIITYHASGVSSEADALRELLPTGRMRADYDWAKVNTPYVVVSELPDFEVETEGTQGSYRSELQTIQFEAFANSRAAAAALVEALENCYWHKKDLEIDNRAQLGSPDVADRLVSEDEQHYKGLLNLTYRLVKSPL